MVLNITLIVIAYLLGSIPSAVWIGRRFYGIDVREHGSHNAGATNTLRVLGLRAALPVFGIDMLKGFVAVMLSHLTAYENGSDAMFDLKIALVAAAVIGHILPLFAGFRGGKGVLCAETMLLIVSFPTGLVSLLIFVGIVWATRYVSLGSICGALIAPIGVLAACGKLPALLSLFCVILLVVKHRSNIGRLIRHKESKLSFKKDLSDKFDDEDF